MFGQIQLKQFIYDGRLSQEEATIWNSVNWSELTGASYKPLLYTALQPVNGILHWFIAEQTIMNRSMTRHIIKMAILQQGDEYSFIGDSVTNIF